MKKRIFSILLCLCMVLMLCPVTALADVPPDTIVGDIDLDGTVTIRDANNLQNYLEGLVSFTDKQLAVADFNGDGEVNYSDWIKLQSFLELPESSITVTNGKAKACGTEISKAASSTRVTLTADSPSDNMVFDKWIVNEGGVTLADASSATTTFTMLVDPVSVTATYKPLSASETGSLAITVNGFEVGKTPNDCTYTFASTIPGITFDEDDILHVAWAKLFFDGSYYTPLVISNTDVFEADTRYQVVIYLDNKGLTEVPAVTVNGNTPEYCTIMTRNDEPVGIKIACDLGTPALQPITLTVPFTTTVKLGGSEAPGKTTFELEVVDNEGLAIGADDVTVSASVTTNGAGNYEGYLTITGSFEQLYCMLGDGVFVQQVNAGSPNWTYDDTVWGVRLENKEIAALATADDAAGYTLRIYPATLMTSGNGSYYVIDEENPVDEMQFTNTYTYSYSAPVRDTATIIIGGEKEESKPVEENPNTGAPVAANMSTLSVLTLAAAVAVLKTKKR